MRHRHGTSLVIVAMDEGAAAAVDDMLYTFESGAPVPLERNVRKVFVSDNVIIASAQLLKARLFHPVPMQYDFKDWVSEFIKLKRGTPNKHPAMVAAAMYDKMRNTFDSVDTMLKDGCWENQVAGDRIVSYVVAGYSKGFSEFHLFELGAQVNADGKGLLYLSPKRYPAGPQVFRLGEDESIQQAINGVQPLTDIRHNIWKNCVAQISSLLPAIPDRLQDAAASAASLVKLEAQFNPQKVGNAVNIAVIDRAAKKAYSVTL